MDDDRAMQKKRGQFHTHAADNPKCAENTCLPLSKC